MRKNTICPQKGFLERQIEQFARTRQSDSLDARSQALRASSPDALGAHPDASATRVVLLCLGRPVGPLQLRLLHPGTARLLLLHSARRARSDSNARLVGLPGIGRARASFPGWQIEAAANEHAHLWLCGTKPAGCATKCPSYSTCSAAKLRR